VVGSLIHHPNPQAKTKLGTPVKLKIQKYESNCPRARKETEGSKRNEKAAYGSEEMTRWLPCPHSHSQISLLTYTYWAGSSPLPHGRKRERERERGVETKSNQIGGAGAPFSLRTLPPPPWLRQMASRVASGLLRRRAGAVTPLLSQSRPSPVLVFRRSGHL
jgi:hypothetical protein